MCSFHSLMRRPSSEAPVGATVWTATIEGPFPLTGPTATAGRSASAIARGSVRSAYSPRPLDTRTTVDPQSAAYLECPLSNRANARPLLSSSAASFLLLPVDVSTRVTTSTPFLSTRSARALTGTRPPSVLYCMTVTDPSPFVRAVTPLSGGRAPWLVKPLVIRIPAWKTEHTARTAASAKAIRPRCRRTRRTIPMIRKNSAAAPSSIASHPRSATSSA